MVLVNVRKKKAPDYANTDTPTWLGVLYACGAVGEMAADLEGAGKRHAVITGAAESPRPFTNIPSIEKPRFCLPIQKRGFLFCISSV